MNDADLIRLARRLSRRYVVEGMSADDLAQEATLRALELKRDGMTEPAHFNNAIRRRLWHLWRSADARADHHDAHAANPNPPHDDPSPESSVDEFDAFAPYLGYLTPRQADVVRLTFADDLDDATIAGRLGLTVSTVRSYRYDAMVTLRHALSSPT